MKTDSTQSVQPESTPINYSSVSKSANESLAPGEISNGASVSNYSPLPSSNVDLARYHLLHSARMSNSRQDTPSLDSMEVSPPYVFLAETSSNQTIHTTLPPYLPGTTTIQIYIARSTHVPPNCQQVGMATFQHFTKNQRVEK